MPIPEANSANKGEESPESKLRRFKKNQRKNYLASLRLEGFSGRLKERSISPESRIANIKDQYAR